MIRGVVFKLSDGSSARLHVQRSSMRHGIIYEPGAVWVEEPLDEGRWVAAFRIVPDAAGAPIVAEVRVFPEHGRRNAGEWDGVHHPADSLRTLIPEGGLTSTLLRSVKVPGVGLFLGALWKEYKAGWGPEAVRALLGPISPETRPARPRGPGRPPIPEVELARVARTYVDAVATNAPVRAVAEAFHIAEGTARKRVHLARKAGMLTAAPKTRAGGALTAKAKAILKASGQRRKASRGTGGGIVRKRRGS